MTSYSIIQKSQLEGAMRLDAEYYQPEYLKLSEKIRSNKFYNKFSEIILGGNYGILPDSQDYIADDKENIYLIRGIDLRRLLLDGKDLIKVPKKYLQKRALAKEGDLLFLVKGATIDAEDSVAIVPKLDKEAIFNGSVFKPIFRQGIIPEFIYTFMRTKYFFLQKRRLVSNVGIEYNSTTEIGMYDFIAPPKEKQAEIKLKISEYFNIVKNSEDLYKQAEKQLLEGIKLEDFDFEKISSSIVNFSDILEAKRMDAEYFQPKYEKIISKIESQNHKRLGDLVSVKKGIEVGAEQYQDEGKIFIRVSSLGKFEINESEQKCLSDKLYEKLKADFEPKKGEILLTKDATPGIAHVVKSDIEGIISGGILRLKLKDSEVDNEYLALCLNSIVGKMHAERDAGGSVIAHWKPEQIKNVVIPILPKESQQKIADLVRQSHQARKKAKELLEEAKRKVEEMIEKNN